MTRYGFGKRDGLYRGPDFNTLISKLLSYPSISSNYFYALKLKDNLLSYPLDFIIDYIMER